MDSKARAASANESLWMATAAVPSFQPLAASVRADVCVVGAGIAGLTTAYLLARDGKSVAVIDDGPIAGGMTQYTTAHLTNAIDDRYTTIERRHGEDGARLAAESHGAAIDRIEEIVRIEGISCDFERLDGYLFLSPDEEVELLDRELEAARRAGVQGVEKLERAPLEGFDSGPCLKFPDQGALHPLKYLAGVAEAFTRRGGQIFTATHADEIRGGTPAQVQVGDHVITADAVVVATNTPINDRLQVHTKQAPYMTYVIGALVPRDSIRRALYWDTGDPYHYIRLQETAEGDVLIVGGEDHKSGQADDTAERLARLEAWTRERFRIERVAYRWAGQVMETIDGLAFIGENPVGQDNVYLVTGDSGMGMTHGTIAGMLLTDLITGRHNAWATLYDPSRKTLRAAGEFVREALNMAAQYGDWVTAGDVDSREEIPAGSGAVLRHGLSKVAVYRDDDGTFHERSAICPHLGCIVAWNDAEKTWDCPCHGSRFDRFGAVMVGPANEDLGEVEPSS